MKRVVVLCQPGRFGRLSARKVARRIARRLALSRLVPPGTRVDASFRDGKAEGWIAPADASSATTALLGAADTVIWLHYSPTAVLAEWLRGMRERSARTVVAGRRPRLVDVADSVRHMLATPRLHHLLSGREFPHLQVFCFRNPAQTDFWLRTQDQRRRQPGEIAFAQAA